MPVSPHEVGLTVRTRTSSRACREPTPAPAAGTPAGGYEKRGAAALLWEKKEARASERKPRTVARPTAGAGPTTRRALGRRSCCRDRRVSTTASVTEPSPLAMTTLSSARLLQRDCRRSRIGGGGRHPSAERREDPVAVLRLSIALQVSPAAQRRSPSTLETPYFVKELRPSMSVIIRNALRTWARTRRGSPSSVVPGVAVRRASAQFGRCSFGQICRCRLVAEGVVAAYEQGTTRLPDRARCRGPPGRGQRGSTSTHPIWPPPRRAPMRSDKPHFLEAAAALARKNCRVGQSGSNADVTGWVRNRTGPARPGALATQSAS